MKTGKVTEIKNVREWAGQHGTVFFLTIALDNGDVGEIGKKSREALKVGDTLSYTVENTQYGLKFKEFKQNGFNGGGGRPGSNASFALSYAKDICVANIAKSEKPLEMSPALAQKVTGVAEVFKNWLDTH